MPFDLDALLGTRPATPTPAPSGPGPSRPPFDLDALLAGRPPDRPPFDLDGLLAGPGRPPAASPPSAGPPRRPPVGPFSGVDLDGISEALSAALEPFSFPGRLFDWSLARTGGTSPEAVALSIARDEEQRAAGEPGLPLLPESFDELRATPTTGQQLTGDLAPGPSRAVARFAADLARDPLTYGALGALSKAGPAAAALERGLAGAFAIEMARGSGEGLAAAADAYQQEGKFGPQAQEAATDAALAGIMAALGGAGLARGGRPAPEPPPAPAALASGLAGRLLDPRSGIAQGRASAQAAAEAAAWRAAEQRPLPEVWNGPDQPPGFQPAEIVPEAEVRGRLAADLDPIIRQRLEQQGGPVGQPKVFEPPPPPVRTGPGGSSTFGQLTQPEVRRMAALVRPEQPPGKGYVDLGYAVNRRFATVEQARQFLAEADARQQPQAAPAPEPSRPAEPTITEPAPAATEPLQFARATVSPAEVDALLSAAAADLAQPMTPEQRVQMARSARVEGLLPSASKKGIYGLERIEADPQNLARAIESKQGPLYEQARAEAERAIREKKEAAEDAGIDPEAEADTSFDFGENVGESAAPGAADAAVARAVPDQRLGHETLPPQDWGRSEPLRLPGQPDAPRSARAAAGAQAAARQSAIGDDAPLYAVRQPAAERRAAELEQFRQQAQRLREETARPAAADPGAAILAAMDTVKPMARGGTGQAPTVGVPELWDAVKGQIPDRATFDQALLQLQRDGRIGTSRGDTGLSPERFAASTPDPTRPESRIMAVHKLSAEPSAAVGQPPAAQPAAGLQISAARRRFGPLGEVSEEAGGGIRVRFRDGKADLVLRETGEIEIDPRGLAKHGLRQLPEGARIEGETRVIGPDVVVRLARGAGADILPHEELHAAMRAARFNEREVEAIRRKYEPRARKEGRAWEEVAAETYGAQVSARVASEGRTGVRPVLEQWVRRLHDFFSRVWDSWSPNAQAAFSRLQRGEVYQRGAAPFRLVREGKPHKLSSTQVNLQGREAADVLKAAGRISDADLAGDGRETQPHVTVRYGLHTTDPAEVARLLQGQGPIRVRMGKTSTFPPSESSDGAAVVKVDVDSPDLHRIHRLIGDGTEVTDSHPDYKPHVTLAYVKPEAASRYVGDQSLAGREVTVDRITFSAKDGRQFEIPLRGPDFAIRGPAPEPAAPPQRGALERVLGKAGAATVDQIAGEANSFLRRTGGAAAELADRFDRVAEDARLGGARALQAVQTARLDLFGKKGPTAEEFSQIVDNLEGGRRLRDPKLQRYADTIRATLAKTYDDATAAGLPLAKREGNYWPRQIEGRFDFDAQVAALAKEKGVSLLEAEEQLAQRRAFSQGKDSNLQRERTDTRRAGVAGREAEYRRDEGVLTEYLVNAYQRIAEAGQFNEGGSRYGKLRELISRIPDPTARAVARRVAEREFGLQGERTLKDEAMAQARAFNSIRQLGGVGFINQITTLGVTAAEAGPGPFVRGLARVARDAKRAEIDATASIFGEASRRLTEATGADAEGLLGAVAGKLPTMRAIGTVDTWQRVVADQVGREFAAAQWQAAQGRGRLAESAARAVRDLGADPARPLTDADLQRAGKRFSDRTQGDPSPRNLPEWMTSPTGKLIAQYMPFMYRMSDYLGGHLRRAAGGDAHSQAVLARALVTLPAMGYLATAGRAALTGVGINDPLEPKQWADAFKSRLIDLRKHPVQAYFQGLLRAGVGGIFQQAIEAAAKPYRTGAEAVVQFLGPTIGGAADLVDAVNRIGKAKEEGGTPAALREAGATALEEIVPNLPVLSGPQLAQELRASGDAERASPHPGWTGRLLDTVRAAPTGQAPAAESPIEVARYRREIGAAVDAKAEKARSDRDLRAAGVTYKGPEASPIEDAAAARKGIDRNATMRRLTDEKRAAQLLPAGAREERERALRREAKRAGLDYARLGSDAGRREEQERAAWALAQQYQDAFKRGDRAAMRTAMGAWLRTGRKPNWRVLKQYGRLEE